MALNQDQVPDLTAKIEDFQLSESESDETELVQVGPENFPLKTSVKKLEFKDGKSFSVVKFSFTNRILLLITSGIPPTHIFEVLQSKSTKTESSSEFVYEVRQISGGDCIELNAAAKFICQSINLGHNTVIVAFGFKDLAEHLTPSFTRSIVQKIKEL